MNENQTICWTETKWNASHTDKGACQIIIILKFVCWYIKSINFNKINIYGSGWVLCWIYRRRHSIGISFDWLKATLCINLSERKLRNTAHSNVKIENKRRRQRRLRRKQMKDGELERCSIREMFCSSLWIIKIQFTISHYN